MYPVLVLVGNTVKRDVRRAESLERRKRILKLRLAGATYQQIAEQVGIKFQSVYEHVQKALADIPVEEADAYRKIQLEQTKALLLGLWPKATKGDVPSCDAVLRILKRQASLLGLDAPRAVDVYGELAADQETLREFEAVSARITSKLVGLLAAASEDSVGALRPRAEDT